jgi:hypothetical protein
LNFTPISEQKTQVTQTILIIILNVSWFLGNFKAGTGANGGWFAGLSNDLYHFFNDAAFEDEAPGDVAENVAEDAVRCEEDGQSGDSGSYDVGSSTSSRYKGMGSLATLARCEGSMPENNRGSGGKDLDSSHYSANCTNT